MRTYRSDNELFRRCDHFYLFELLIFSAGMMGAYTYMMRGQVFCNAQTLNVVMMAIELGQRHYEQSAYYLIPIGAYLAGAIVAEFLPERTLNKYAIHSGVYIIALEMAVLALIGFVPLSAPDQIAQVAVNFIASMQFTNFRKSEGYPMATTFATNHLRQIGIAIVDYRRTRDLQYRKRLFKHLRMLLMFFAGAAVLSLATGPLQERAIWLALIPLTVCFIIHLWADLG